MSVRSMTGMASTLPDGHGARRERIGHPARAGECFDDVRSMILLGCVADSLVT
jgi:hypothetical protein